MTSSHTEKLVIDMGIGWIKRGDGRLYSAMDREYVGEIERLREQNHAVVFALQGLFEHPGEQEAWDEAKRILSDVLTDEQQTLGNKP